MTVTLAFPSKGRLRQDSLDTLTKAGMTVLPQAERERDGRPELGEADHGTV